MYRCTGTEGNKTTTESRYYISDLSLEAEKAAELIRGHWSIENQQHWFLDVCFGEDECRARTNRAPENLSVLRKTALCLLRKTGVPENALESAEKCLEQPSMIAFYTMFCLGSFK